MIDNFLGDVDSVNGLGFYLHNFELGDTNL